jgi:hypothetical protein
MTWKWITPTSEPHDRAASGHAARIAGDARGQSPYSDQYETIIAQGHARPTPSLGAPALVWHVAIWPRRSVSVEGAAEPCDPHDTAGEKHTQAKAAFEIRRELWLQQINAFLEQLQNRCALKAERARQLRLVQPHDLKWQPSRSDPEHFFKPIHVLEQEIVPFTLWWGEEGAEAGAAGANRVCVHPEVNADYACISFYMDIGKPWNRPHLTAPDASLGARRNLLMSAVDDIRRICEAQLEPVTPGGAAAVDLDALPEVLHSPDGRTPQQLSEALNAHRNLLYVDVWEAFAAGMACRPEDIAGARGEVFASIRGLVMPTAGMAADRPA